jgi:hypothetical protein
MHRGVCFVGFVTIVLLRAIEIIASSDLLEATYRISNAIENIDKPYGQNFTKGS